LGAPVDPLVYKINAGSSASRQIVTGGGRDSCSSNAKSKPVIFQSKKRREL
jgi:hypothetical protein